MSLFSARLRYERIANGYTQKQMAQKLHITQATYQRYEKCGTKRGREPDFEMLIKIADILKVSVDYLLGRIE